MDVATEEFSHLEIVGATSTMRLDGINGQLKDATNRSNLMKLLKGSDPQSSTTPIRCAAGAGRSSPCGVYIVGSVDPSIAEEVRRELKYKVRELRSSNSLELAELLDRWQAPSRAITPMKWC